MLMRKMNLCAQGYHRRKSSYGQPKDIEVAIKENLLNLAFDQTIIDAIWGTDITYLTCFDGRLYLCTYIDLTTRILRCLAIDSHMKKTIVLNPLLTYHGSLPQLIHSDKTSQYRSYAFQEFLVNHQIDHSMSRLGTAVDHAMIESYHRSIKRELIIPNKHRTKTEMKVLITEYLTNYYPNKRIHTKLKMTPKQYEENLLQSSNAL